MECLPPLPNQRGGFPSLGVRQEAVAFGVETAGLKSITLQAALTDTTHQMVGDVAVAGRGERYKPIRP